MTQPIAGNSQSHATYRSNPLRSGKAPYAALALSIVALGWLAMLHWREGNLLDVWLSADQQGQLAFLDLDYSLAAARFEDSEWKGHASYRAGDYATAAGVLGEISLPRTLLERGNALMKGREYAAAVTAYEKALRVAPGWPAASENLRLARHIKSYLEKTREQLDTGDNAEHSADGVVFDKEKAGGLEMVITNQGTVEQLSAEKWMRTVNTQMQDFLRTRFALEAAHKDAP